MPLDGLETKADLLRFIENELLSRPGFLNVKAVQGLADQLQSIEDIIPAEIAAGEGLVLDPVPDPDELELDFGTGHSQVRRGDDAAYTDSRSPTAHHASHEPGGSDPMAVDAGVGVGSLRTLGTGAAQAAAGDHGHAQADITGLIAALAAKQATSEKGMANGYAGLDAGGKVASSALPAIAITSTSVVASQAAQLALTAQEGDVAVRSDESKAYIHNGGTAGTMADWTLLATPTDLVLSVNGKVGVVTLDVADFAGISAFMATVLDDANAGAARATLGLVIGTDVAAQGDARFPSSDQKAALAGTAGSPSDLDRYLTEQGPRADVPWGGHRITQLADGFDTHDAATISQLFSELLAGLAGALLKRPVYAASIAALPAHSRSGNTLTASANGTLTTAFGAAAAAFTAGAFQLKSGTYGTGNGQFYLANSVAVDGSGNIFVVDSGNNRVQKFNSSGVYQSQFGTTGTGNGEFNYPIGIAIDGSGNIWVVDSNNERVQKFNSSGVYQSQFGSLGTGNGEFQNPLDIAIDGSGNIFVTDAGNARVQKFNSSGVYQSQFGSAGTGNGQFAWPAGLDIDGSGNIFVADYVTNSRVQKFNSSGVYQSQFGTYGTGNGQFDRPYGLDIDGSGNIWVSDAVNNRVQKFNSSGVYQSQFGTSGTGNGQLSVPQGVIVDGSSIWVVDGGNSRVQKFSTTVTAQAVDLLVRHEGSGSHLENGIYKLDDPGSAGTPWIMTRRDDADESSELAFGALVTAYREDDRVGGRFILATTGPIDLNVTALVWNRQTGGGIDYGLVTALPTGALPGDRCTYKADATNGIFWNLIYDGAGSYPWKVISGPPLLAEVDSDQSTTSTTYANLGTVGPTVTTPLAGDYDVTVDAEFYNTSSGLHGMIMSYAIGGTAASDNDRFACVPGTVDVIAHARRKRRKTGLAASTALQAKYKVGGGTGWFRRRLIEAMPVRVG